MEASGRLDSALAEYRRRVEIDILPFWAVEGFDADAGLFRERLDCHGVDIASAPRRSMVQARQIHVFADAARRGLFPGGGELARRSLAALATRYGEDGDASLGFAFSIDGAGRVASSKRDAYGHAFILLALASAYRLTADPSLIAMAERLSGFIDRRLIDPGHGGLFDDDGADRAGPKRQNPLMHMLEAYLAMHDAWPEGPFIDKAARLVGLFRDRLYRAGLGVLPETFHVDWTDRSDATAFFEPGHHFEWVFLLAWFDRIAGADHREIAGRLWATGLAHGVGVAGLCHDRVGLDFRPMRRSSRLWPHAEAVKAAAIRFEAGHADAAQTGVMMLDALNRTFLGRPFAGGWIDHLGEDGRPLVDYVPASSLYHLYGASIEATRVLGGGAGS